MLGVRSVANVDDPLPVVIGALGAAVFCLSIAMFIKTRRFIRTCRSCDGHVVHYADDLEGDPRFPVVAFRDDAGRAFEITRPSASPLPSVGTTLRVTYDPADPNNAWAAGTFAPWAIPSTVALAGLGLVLTAIIMRIV